MAYIPERVDQIDYATGKVIDHLNKPNFIKLLSVFAKSVDNLEGQLFDLLDMLDIDQATGIWLDYIGKIVGVSRGTKDDDEYRKAIKVRILVNTAEGTPDTIINLLQYYASATNVDYTEYPVAYFRVECSNDDNLLSGTVYDLINDAKPAGVGFSLIQNLDGDRFKPLWYNEDGSVYNNSDSYAIPGWIVLYEDTLQTVSDSDPTDLDLSDGTTLTINTRASATYLDVSDDDTSGSLLVNDDEYLSIGEDLGEQLYDDTYTIKYLDQVIITTNKGDI